jgi:flagellin
MASTINTNVMSLNAQRNLSTSQGSMATSLQRLSSGLRVNSAKDDAAGLAIAERMQSQVRGMSVAVRNANDGVSLAQTAEGALSKVSDSLQRMRELAVQSANATNTTTDRDALADEFKELQSEIKRVVDSTRFNGLDVLKGGQTFTFQVGANNTAVDRVDIKVNNMATGALQTSFTEASTLITSAAAAGTALDNIDAAITAVNTERSKMGASANRFESIIGSLQVNVENQSAARGRIIDADFAVETANFTRAQILQQAGNAMLAQANSAPQQVTALLRF